MRQFKCYCVVLDQARCGAAVFSILEAACALLDGFSGDVKRLSLKSDGQRYEGMLASRATDQIGTGISERRRKSDGLSCHRTDNAWTRGREVW